MSSTATTTGAREHARSQAAAATAAQPDLPAGITEPLMAQRIPAGGYAGVVLGRGTRIRLADPFGAACAHLLLFRAESPWERLNVADTLKVPWQAYLTTGHPLLTDQGRVLATVVADSAHASDEPHHDALCGPSPQARQALRLAGAKHGLTNRDIAAGITFFRGVRVEPDGALRTTGGSGAGATVDLLLHLPSVLLVANAPHPLDPAPCTDLDLVAWAAPGELTTLANHDPEYLRAVQNTEQAWRAAQTQETTR